MALNDIQEKAVPYYVCMIIRILAQQESFTLDSLVSASHDPATRTDSGQPTFLLQDDQVIGEAIHFLESRYVLSHVLDEFGPDLILRHSNFSENRDTLYRQEDTVFNRYSLAGERRGEWLFHALRVINAKIPLESPADSPTSPPTIEQNEDYWEPLPLDRQDETLSAVIQKIDMLAEGVRGDNGYGANFGEEKRFVLDKLQAISKVLEEEATISWMYIREFAIKPITILTKRFGSAAIGVAAEAAKASLKEWLKKKGLTFLDGL